MAMSGDRLGDAIKAAIDAMSEADRANRTKLFRAIGGAIVSEIATHARVTVAADVPAGIPVATAGTAAAQTGATTAPSVATTTTGTIA